ncbi:MULTISPECIES: AraC family transcriptional regulator [unclassified Duganella]|jgi:AraC-like DNA-binding protein|uniref:AraC family transcriptional regulator n=1 Tax=unclassified Duganella TaxID=2636909 RepID=UPI00088F97A7|nr:MULTISPECIES: AraC family transcriptional regulator [unclassified Duganella]SDG28906.1 AraC-type DNA-binding protein [Duganella sp. OV458]SDK71745.1 transcriptional regulator, AraC family [Duganella sp. OV510]
MHTESDNNLAARRGMGANIADPFFAEGLFDALPDVVFFVKDVEGRYVVVNQTLVQRCGQRHKSALIGKTPAEVFAQPFGHTYMAQDLQVLAGEAAIEDQLELHLYPNRDPGWCLTRKHALRDPHGRIVGLTGISRDLAMADKKNPAYRKVAAAVHVIHEQYGQPLQLPELARIANMSVAQIERYFLRIFHLTPRQMIIQTRVDAASRMLNGGASVAEIAQACGYGDHSAFTRQFKATTGLTPSQYRQLASHRASD